MDDTLIPFKPASQKAFDSTMKHFGIGNEGGEYQIYLEINREVWKSLERHEIDMATLKSLRIERFFEHIGHYSSDALEFNDAYLAALADHSFLFPEIFPVIQELREQHEMYIVTNGMHIAQRGRWNNLRLCEYFNDIFISEELGCAKPSKMYFDKVFASIGKPSRKEVLVIGDNLNSDILGANRYGLDSVYFDHGQSRKGGTGRPTYTIDHLSQIPEIVS